MDRQPQKLVLGVVLLFVSTAAMVALAVRFGGWVDGEHSTATAAAEGLQPGGPRLSPLVDRGRAGVVGPGVVGPGRLVGLPVDAQGSGPPARLSQRAPRPPSTSTPPERPPAPRTVVRSAPVATVAPSPSVSSPSVSSPSVPSPPVPSDPIEAIDVGAGDIGEVGAGEAGAVEVIEVVQPVPTSTTAGTAPDPILVPPPTPGTVAGEGPPGPDPDGPPPSTTPPPEQQSPPSRPPTVEVAAGTSPAPLSAVEREIVRLTNQLRADPNGPLRRQGPLTDCEGRIPVDWNTGTYLPVDPVAADAVASEQVSRPWAAQLTTELRHRPRAGVTALEQAGIAVWVAGENIAYHSYPDTAHRHFAGWRESDAHFCNLMDPGFTHLGVGEVRGADGLSYAAQNFYSLH